MYYCVSEMHVWHQNTTSGEPETLSMKTVTIVYLFIVYDILSIFLVKFGQVWKWSNQSLDSYIWSAHAPELS